MNHTLYPGVPGGSDKPTSVLDSPFLGVPTAIKADPIGVDEHVTSAQRSLEQGSITKLEPVDGNASTEGICPVRVTSKAHHIGAPGQETTRYVSAGV